MSQAPSSRIERRREKTSRLLIEVALGLFYEKGIDRTKIEDITERADIGKGTFYQYFETKEELLRTLLEEGLEELLSRTTEEVKTARPGPRMIRRIIHAQLDFELEHPEYRVLFHQVRGLLQFRTESVKELRQVYDAYLDRLGQVIRHALNSRNGEGVSPRQIAMAVSAFSLGLLTHPLLFDKAGEFRDRRDDIQAQLERSIYALV